MVPVGFFDKALQAVNRPFPVVEVLRSKLEITVSRLRSRRLDAKGQQAAFALDQPSPRLHGRAETAHIADHVIGREHDADRLRILREHGVGGETRARRGIASHRFGKDVVCWQLGKDFVGGLGRRRGRHNPHPLRRHQTSESLECHPQ
jgi:hypothetical protein